MNFLDEVLVNSEGVLFQNNDEQILSLLKNKINFSQVQGSELSIQLRDDLETHGLELVEIRLHSVGQTAQEVLEKADQRIRETFQMGEVQEDLLLSIPDVSLYQPRGKYSFNFYQSYLKLHGMSFSYNISYDSILNAFLLPLPDDESYYFALYLSKPIRQGQTQYHFLICNIKKDQ